MEEQMKDEEITRCHLLCGVSAIAEKQPVWWHWLGVQPHLYRCKVEGSLLEDSVSRRAGSVRDVTFRRVWFGQRRRVDGKVAGCEYHYGIFATKNRVAVPCEAVCES
ncbi:hypothetical protein GCK32_003172 [Trichostrongylus colubriformis]|uniref:Uncharacterized protein n=1 Tax=Trichostrongylus colubriformis TaxID=6319 RepID=A0AAN8FQQ5_TRICO